MFDKKQHSTTENNQNTENAASSNYPKDAEKNSNSSKGCGCGCKHAAPADEEVIEIEEEQRWDY